nr:DNA alkylation repair protein [Streptococcus acidominimus]
MRASVRRKMTKEFLNPYKKAPLNWTFIEQVWKSPYREMHYVAIDYLAMNKRGIAV